MVQTTKQNKGNLLRGDDYQGVSSFRPVLSLNFVHLRPMHNVAKSAIPEKAVLVFSV